MFFCPDCHVSNRVDAKFCRKCGKSRSDLERANVTVAVVQSSTLVTQTTTVSEASESVSETTTTTTEVVVGTEGGATDAADATASDGGAENIPAANVERSESQHPQCPSCWETLRSTDKFCCWCGEAQPNRVLPFMKLCLECSTFLPEKANYCYSCGTDVGYSSRRKVRLPVELFKDEDSEFFPRFDA